MRHHSRHAKKHSAKKTPFIYVIDKLTLSVAVIEPLVTLPQVVTIMVHHSASGVSLSTWVGYDIITLIWLCYASVHKIRVILLESGLFMVVQTAVIVAGLAYGARW